MFAAARARSRSAITPTPSWSPTREPPAARRRSATRSSRPCPAPRCSSASRRGTARRTRRSASTSTSRDITRSKAPSPSRAEPVPRPPSSAGGREARPRGVSPVIAQARRTYFLPLVSGLIALSWLTLWIWEQSPYGRYLDHGQWTEAGLAASLCRLLPAGPVLPPVLLSVTGHLLMSAAMMLPTAFPLLSIFARLTAERPDRGRLMA